MATQKYIKINGSLINFSRAAGDSVDCQFQASAPDQCKFTLKQPYGSALPIAGQSVQVYTRADVLIFGGVISEVDWAGADEGSDYLAIPIQAVGYNDRLFHRTTWNRATFKCARYASYAGHVNTNGTDVFWVAEDKFAADLAGKVIQINGSPYTVFTVVSPDKLILVSTAGVQADVTYAYTVYSGDVIKDLLDNYCDFEGFTYGSGTTTINQGAAVSKLVFDPPITVADAIQQVLAGNPTFYFASDPTQLCYFGPRTLVASPSDFTNSAGWKRAIQGVETTEDVRNTEISVTTWDAVQPTVDPFTGDDVSTSWFLSGEVAVMVSAELNGVAINVVDAASGSVGDLYFRPADRAIWQDPARPVMSASDTLTVSYKRYGDNLIEVTDDASRAARAVVEGSGLGRREEVIDRTNLAGKTDALAEATSSINRLKNNFNRVTLVTKDPGYRAGQYLTVNLTNRKINLNLFIDAVEASDAECQGGNFDFYYTLTCVSITRRIMDTDVLRVAYGGASSEIVARSSTFSGGVIAGNVAINLVNVAIAPDAIGQRVIDVQYTPPSPLGEFAGVYVEIEAPSQVDGSTTLDGTPALDGTTSLAGPKGPYTFGPFSYAVTGGSVQVSIPEPSVLNLPMACRARLISFSRTVTNLASSSPVSAFTINAPTVANPNSATAYCQNPTISVDAPVTVAATRRSQPRTTIPVHMTPPLDPKFKGVVYKIVTANGGLFVQSGLTSDALFDISFDTPNWQEECVLYALGSDGVNINPIVPGVTPSAPVSIGTLKPSNSAVATASASGVLYIVDPNGAQDWTISAVTWADADLPKPIRSAISAARDPHTWTTFLTFQATDASGNPAPPEQGGIEVLVASFGYTGDIHSTSNISSYGFQPIGSIYTYAQLRLYAGNRAASGFDDPINSTLQTTCWAGAAYSRQNFGDAPAGVIPATRFDPATLGDGVKKEAGTNKLVAAVGSEFHFVGGDLLMNHIDMSKATNLSAQFSLVGSTQTINNLSANLLISGLLQIGGGTNKVSLAKFFDTAGTPQLMGFIGDDSGGSGYVGAWFRRCGVGGPNPLSPNFFTDAAGNVAAKAVTIYDLTGAYGFIGDDGAGHRGGWFKQLWIGGTGPANAQLSTDGSGNVSLDGASLVVSKTFGGVTNSLSIAPGNPFAAPLIADNGVGSTLSLGPLGITAEFPGTSLKTTISQTVVKIEDAAHYAQMAPDFLDIDNSVWVAGGKLAKYDGVATDGMGVPPIYANVVLAAQTASVAAANLRVGGVVAPAGLYRVSVYILTTVAGSAGTVTINILFNDGIAARTDSFVISLAALAYGGTSFVIGNDGVHDVQYSTTVAGATGSPQYAFRVVVERLV